MARNRTRRGPELLGALLDSLFKRDDWVKKSKEFDVLRTWSDAVGARMAEHSRAVRIHSGKLYVEVDEPARAQMLSVQKGAILVKLNRKSGGPTVRDIVIRRGKAGAGNAKKTNEKK